MISFENTEIAFSSKQNNDLKKAYWLFKLIGSPSIVSMGSILTPIALRWKLPIKKIIKSTIFKQFVGGETIQESLTTAKRLAEYKIGTILDYSIEGKESENDFDLCMAATIETIHQAKNNKSIPFSVFKVTGLARFVLLEKVSSNKTPSSDEEQEYNKVKNRIETICKQAYECDVPIFIDAEESWIQNAIDDLTNEMMRKYNKQKPIVYNTYQLYRKDRLEYLKKSFDDAVKHNYFLGAKLVRGAYMEKERERAKQYGYASPIQETKQDTDKDYDAALKFCIHNSEKIAICAGTHNEKSSLLLVELMQQKNIPNSNAHIFFSQLYGMSDHISYNLANAGYNVAKYVPYGPVEEVLPYMIRRAQENTSVKGQTSRELNLIIKELNRRKSK